MKRFAFPLFVFLCLVATLYLKHSSHNRHFTLHKGDLLFQDINCGELCDGISEVTYGYDNTHVSHVGMVIYTKYHHALIIEAIGDKVQQTTLNKFLSRSLDESGNPRVMVGRLKPQYRYLINNAVNYSITQTGMPYNESFLPNTQDSFYCSQLIYDAFSHANDNVSIFGQNIMTFKDPKTHQTTKAWQNYFNSIHAPVIPEGKIGTNPGMMSRESSIEIIHFYGNLRHYTSESKY